MSDYLDALSQNLDLLLDFSKHNSAVLSSIALFFWMVLFASSYYMLRDR